MNSFEAGMAAGALMMLVAWIVNNFMAAVTRPYRKERQRLNELRELGRMVDETKECMFHGGDTEACKEYSDDDCCEEVVDLSVENIRRKADKVSKLLADNPIKA